MNSSPVSSKISRSSSSASVLTRSEISFRRTVSSSMPGFLHVPQDPHQGQLDLVQKIGQSPATYLLPLPARERLEQQRVGRGGVFDIGGQPALLAQLPERVARRAGSSR